MNAAVPSRETLKDRTYTSALAVKKWLEQNNAAAAKVDVLTLGPHGRRSQLLFERALGDKVSVGIISIADEEYDAKHWWHTSEGVREVISETIAYVYAKVLFWPARTDG